MPIRTLPAAFVWAADPVLLEAGPFTVRWYGLLFAAAFVVGYGIVRRMFVREGKREADLDRLLVYMMVGAVVGARLGEVLFYQPGYYLRHPAAIVAVWEGGLASHGGAVGLFLALWLYARRRPDQPYLWLLDRVAVPTALGGAFIRVGNFFNSEILGAHAEVPWAVVFAREGPLARHPAQLYEAVSYGLIFLILLAVYRRYGRALPRGLTLGLFLVLVFTARFTIEFVKVRQAAYGAELPLSVGQWLSLPLIAAGVLLLVRAARHSATVNRVPAEVGAMP